MGLGFRLKLIVKLQFPGNQLEFMQSDLSVRWTRLSLTNQFADHHQNIDITITEHSCSKRSLGSVSSILLVLQSLFIQPHKL